jgi:hypothetical protein
VLYRADGKLKPGALVSTITDSVATVKRDFDTQMKSINGIQNTIKRFFGDNPATTPNHAEIATAVSAGGGLRLEYDNHITQFNTLKNTANRINNVVTRFFNTDKMLNPKT